MHKVCHQRIHSGNKDLQINNEKKIYVIKGEGERLNIKTCCILAPLHPKPL